MSKKQRRQVFHHHGEIQLSVDRLQTLVLKSFRDPKVPTEVSEVLAKLSHHRAGLQRAFHVRLVPSTCP